MFNHLTACKQMTDVKLNCYCNIQNHLTVCKQMTFGSFKNIINKICIYKSYI